MLFEVQTYFKIIIYCVNVRFKGSFRLCSTEDFVKLEINSSYLSFPLELHLEIFILTKTTIIFCIRKDHCKVIL